MSFSQTLAHLNAAQKPGDGVPAYTRWVNRRVARVFAASAVALGIGPNGVTFISAAVSTVGIILMWVFPPSILLGIVVALCLALGYALDSADGQVARVTGASSPAGEWLDHVVDSIRTPLIHASVIASLILHPGAWPNWNWFWVLPLAYMILTAGQFMSQILAEQLRKTHGAKGPATGGALRSFINLHTDAGTLCWIFIFWGFGAFFCIVYILLFAANAATVALSMRRKYISLSRPQEEN